MNLRSALMFFILITLAITRVATRADAENMAVGESLVVDSAGRRIAVDHPFQRIISLYGAHTENLFSMGAGQQLIGVSPHDDWPPEAKAKPVFSYHDGLEKFLAARPDLVLIRPMIDRGYAQLVSRLETHGIVVVSLQPTVAEEISTYWMVLGELSGQPARARQMINHFRGTVAGIQSCTSSIESKKRVYFESIHSRMRTFLSTSIPIFALETAGGINVAAHAVPRRKTIIADFGKERILSLANEIDVYLAQFGPMNRPSKEMIKAEPGYGLIRAVQQGQIYLIDEKMVSRPTMRLLKGICRIGSILYPDKFDGAGAPNQCSLPCEDDAGKTPSEDTPL